MNVATIKLLCWLTSAGLSLGLSAYAFHFFSRLEQNQPAYDLERAEAVLTTGIETESRVTSLIDYDDVLRAFRNMNWTGKEAIEKIKNAPVKPVETQPTHTAVASLLKLHMIQVHLSDPTASAVFVKYMPSSGFAIKDGMLRVGDALPGRYSNVVVDAIRIEGVDFRFEDGDRPIETIAADAGDDEPLIVEVGPDGVRMPVVSSVIPPALNRSVGRPKQTTQIAQNRYRLGTEDAQYINDNYAEILTREVRYRTWHDPRTGRRAGIEIQEVQPDSVAARHGVQSGDIIISINDQPVTSEQEAIKFVKNNAENYSSWEVVIENMGRQRTISYEGDR